MSHPGSPGRLDDPHGRGEIAQRPAPPGSHHDACGDGELVPLPRIPRIPESLDPGGQTFASVHHLGDGRVGCPRHGSELGFTPVHRDRPSIVRIGRLAQELQRIACGKTGPYGLSVVILEAGDRALLKEELAFRSLAVEFIWSYRRLRMIHGGERRGFGIPGANGQPDRSLLVGEHGTPLDEFLAVPADYWFEAT